MIQPAQSNQETAQFTAVDKPIPTTTTTQQLVEQMIKEINILTQNDRSETTVTLQNPPLFAGAQLSITSFDSARGELNIKFANLTPPAQQLLAGQQQNLILALETRGYQVHIFTATTYNEQPIAQVDLPREQDRDQREGDRQQNRQSRQNQRENEG